MESVSALQRIWVQSAAALVFSLFLSSFPFFASDMQLKSNNTLTKARPYLNLFLPFFKLRKPQCAEQLDLINQYSNEIGELYLRGSWAEQHGSFQGMIYPPSTRMLEDIDAESLISNGILYWKKENQ